MINEDAQFSKRFIKYGIPGLWIWFMYIKLNAGLDYYESRLTHLNVNRNRLIQPTARL